jgi:DNA repair exonuclease SbcCD ATPase subunit
MDTEPDLTNVDYEDVLHLYRGWRKSEGALKEKTKELNALKIRVKQLQDSHVKFRAQIQSLESAKELTISLQTELSTIKQENLTLLNDNKELKELNTHAESILKERAAYETEQTKAFRDVSRWSYDCI